MKKSINLCLSFHSCLPGNTDPAGKNSLQHSTRWPQALTPQSSQPRHLQLDIMVTFGNSHALIALLKPNISPAPRARPAQPRISRLFLGGKKKKRKLCLRNGWSSAVRIDQKRSSAWVKRQKG